MYTVLYGTVNWLLGHSVLVMLQNNFWRYLEEEKWWYHHGSVQYYLWHLFRYVTFSSMHESGWTQVWKTSFNLRHMYLTSAALSWEYLTTWCICMLNSVVCTLWSVLWCQQYYAC